MRLVVQLPETLVRRVEEVAAERDMTPEQVAMEAIEDRLGASGARQQAPSFIGIGASSTTERIGRRHREIIRQHFAHRSAREA
jgi:hypothetical protein